MRLTVTLFALFWTSHLLAQSDCDGKIIGAILDQETKEPLPFATVKILNSDLGTVSDKEGNFTIANVCEKEVDLEVRFIGYKTIVHHHDFHHGNPNIYLASDATELESIVIEEQRVDQIKSLSIQKRDIDKAAIVSSSIAELTEDVTGVSMLKTGANVSKPIIHGLHSNRVLVINDGVRHAYQAWGEEHAPEIDPSHVDRIEVVKGAGTVKYGPEALGGVILYNAKRPALNEQLFGSVSSSYQTNGRVGSGQLNLGEGYKDIAWNVGGYGTYQADLSAPDYDLTNTGKREYGTSFNTLLHQPNFDLQVSGSYFNQEFGILRGSIAGNLTDLQNAIDRGVPIPTLPSSYSIQNPKQETKHGLLKSDLSVFLGEHIFKLQYAYQHNIRREFDVRRGELNDRPVIFLDLTSHNVEAEWIQPTRGIWSGNSGIQLLTQNSFNEPGSNPVNFIPDYDVLNIGAFTVQSLNFDAITWELGARFDYHTLSVADTIRETATYSDDLQFANATFTFGARKQLTDAISLFSNIGSSWRPPNVAELYSFGYRFSRIQFGLWRYDFTPQIVTPVTEVFDESTREVPAEKSFKWVGGVELKSDRVTAEFIVYANQINDYIFLRPFGITINVAGTFPYFLYDQTNAFFLGSDWDLRYRHSTSLYSEIKVSYVYATELKQNQPFIEIPPLNISYSLDYKKGHWGFGVNLNYTATQWNAPDVIEPITFQNGNVEVVPEDFFDFMVAPEDFFLAGLNGSYEKDRFKLQLKVDNLLNTSYRIYTNRLRYFSDEPGRNFTVSATYQF